MADKPESAQRCTEEVPHLAVLHLCPDLELNDTAIDTVAIAEYATSKNWRTIVVGNNGAHLDSLLRAGGEYFNINTSPSSWYKTIQTSFKVAKIARTTKPAFLHARANSVLWLTYLAAKIAGLPFIATVDNDLVINKQNRIALKSASKIIATSGFIKESLKKQGIAAEKISTIIRGYDPRHLDPRNINSTQVDKLWGTWDIPTATVVILTTAPLEKGQGHEVFIKALDLIKNLPFKAIIAGDYDDKQGYFTDLWSQVEALDLNRRVLFIGKQDDTASVYTAADVVVYPSTTPATATRLPIQAQAMSKAVIVSGHGANLEIIKSGETGWLVKPDNPEKLALALTDAITDTIRLHKMGQAAAKWVKGSFTNQKMCEQELEIYQEMISLPKGAVA